MSEHWAGLARVRPHCIRLAERSRHPSVTSHRCSKSRVFKCLQGAHVTRDCKKMAWHSSVSRKLAIQVTIIAARASTYGQVGLPNIAGVQSHLATCAAVPNIHSLVTHALSVHIYHGWHLLTCMVTGLIYRRAWCVRLARTDLQRGD